MKKKLICILLAAFLILYPQQALGTASASIDYQLPYPGILPDSPIYIFKTIRDRIAEYLISDPIKKAEFNRNKTDVLIASAVSLARQKKNASIVESTISKAENHFKQALNNTKEAKKQGTDVTEVANKLVLSNQKYQEVVGEIEKKVEKNQSANWREEQKKINSLKKGIEQIAIEAKRITKEKQQQL